MIPAGRQAVDAQRAARMHGLALATARKKKLFDQPGFPSALTRGKNKRLWDEAQVQAHANGEPIPTIVPLDAPSGYQDGEHPDDLLEREEAAQEWKVTTVTWNGYVVGGYTPEPDEVIGGRELWRRRTLREFKRPGQGGGAGRPQGARDRYARTVKPRADRLAEVHQVLDEADSSTSTSQLVLRIMQVTDLSKAKAYELLSEARKQRT